ncbi:MAG: hypothetical protein ACP5HK_02350 [Acidilobus sp.]
MIALWPLWASFSSAFLLNLVPFGAPPYVIVVAYEARYGGLGLWPPVLAAAAGAAAAKMVMYYLGIGLRRPLRRNRNIRLLARYSETGWVYLLAFIAAVVPLVPLDDFVYLAGGASGLRAGLMAGAAVAGKFVKTIAEVLAVTYVSYLISSLLHISPLYVLMFFVVSGAVIGVLTFAVDWESWARRLGINI